jgi:superfamily II DNA or RNA helicase
MGHRCTIRLLDEVNCVCSGLTKDHIAYFYEKYGIFAENYFFNPKYQLGSWDGKIRYFHKTGKTYITLLPEIIPFIAGLGYDIDLEDRRKAAPVTPSPIDEDFFNDVWDEKNNRWWKMRDYQVEMVNTLMNNGYGIGIAGTGAGKTGMCAALALSYERAANLRSIIIVPDTTLTNQTRKAYAFFGLDVGEFSGTTKDLKHKHIVSTWQTLKNNPQVITEFQMVIVDEAQGLRGPVLNKLLIEYGKHISYRFGVTGTLPEGESDAWAVKIAVGDVQYEIPAHVLIEQGHLATLDIDIIQLAVNLKPQYEMFLEQVKDDPELCKTTYTKFKDSYFPDFTSEKSFLHSQPERLEWIAQFLINQSSIDQGNTLCLVNGIPFGKKLAKKIPDAVFLHGKDDVKVREEIYQKFSDNDNLIVIATVNIAGTGLDIDRIFNLVFVDIGKSFIRTIQAIGRGLRKAHDKEHVNVADICSDLKYSKRHVAKRIKFYKDAKYPHKKRKVDY